MKIIPLPSRQTADTRACTQCGLAKPATLEHFPPHKPGKYGLHSWCRPCKKIIDAERRVRPDQLARQQAWRDANKNYTNSYNAQYRKANKSTPYVAAWRAKNLEHAREDGRRRIKKRRSEDFAFLLKGRLSARLNSMLKDKSGKQTEKILGYTCEQLKAHIERQFTSGMSWELLRRGQIEIDHIVPVSAFNITSLEDPDLKVCWALTNLRPMWTSDNRSKGGKRLYLV